MKRLTILFALMVLTLALLLSACGGKGDSDTDKESEKSNEQSTETSTETNTESKEHVHTEEIIAGVKPTCTKEGLSDGKKCSECEEILVEQVPLGKTMHTYVDSYTCTVCGETTLESQGLEYTYIEENNAYYVSGIGTCTDNDIVIPYEYNGLPVIGIGNNAFYECINITSVTLSNNAIAIEEGAFRNCYGMVRFVGGTNLDSNHFWLPAFSGCTKLMEIYDLSEDPITYAEVYYGLNGYGGQLNEEKHGGPHELIAVHHKASEPSVIIEENDFMFITKDNKNYLLGYKGNAADVELPQVYNDEPYYIFKYAFSNCTSIKNISIPDSVLGVLKAAFALPQIFSSNDERLNLNFAYTEYEGGKYLGNEENPYLVLVNCSGGYPTKINEKTKIVAGDTVLVSSETDEIIIPDSVVCLGEKALNANDKIIVIGKSVKEIDCLCFYGNPSSFKVDEQNPYFKAIDGSLYSKDGKALVKYAGNGKNFIIPDGVTIIKENAISKDIENLTMPKSLTKLDENAITDCAIKNLNYLGSVSSWVSLELGETIRWADIDATIKEVTLSHSIPCENLYFNGELAIDIVIPGDVAEIRDYAFSNCKSLKSVTIEEGVKKIGDYAFQNCMKLRNIKLPESLEEFGLRAFASCAIKTITIPKNVQLNSYDAFSLCYDLFEIYDLTDFVYEGEISTSLQGNNVVIHKSLDEPSIFTTIGDFTFASLEKGVYLIEYTGKSSTVELPKDFNGEEYIIDFNTIDFCSEEQITEVIIPEGFALTEKTKDYTNFFMTNIISVKIKAKWEEVPPRLFANCGNLETVELPEGLKTIGASAFSQCRSLCSIIIPSTVTEIDITAFRGCASLVEVYNLSSIEFECNTGSDYFRATVHTSLDEESIIKREGDFIFARSNTGDFKNEMFLISYVGNDKIITLPEEIDGESYIIGEYALAKPCIEGIVFPKYYDALSDSFANTKMFLYEETPSFIDVLFVSFEKIFEEYIYRYSENEPATEGNYWHYVDGVVTIWQ